MRAGRALLLLAGLLALAACEEDRSQAEAGAIWLTEHRLNQPFGPIGAIDRITVESAEEIRMTVDIPDRRHADAIDTQSLMFQNMLAKYACPKKSAALWPLLGEEIKLRVDLMSGDHHGRQRALRGPREKEVTVSRR